MLPREYTRVEWIESTGSQYIDTGFKPNQDTRVVMDCDVSDRSVQQALFGSRNGGSSGGFLIFTYNNCDGYQVDYSNAQKYPIGGDSSGRHIIELNKNRFYVDGVLYHTFTYAAFTGSYNALIGSANSGGNNMTSSVPTYMKIYSCKVYDNDVLVRDYVPCLNANSVAGLFDLVNSNFYANAGTGVFGVGPIVLPPVAPQSVRTAVSVLLRWEASDGAFSYNIYRDGALIGSTVQTEYVDTDIEENREYTYGISAVGDGGEGNASQLIVYTRTGYFMYKPVIQTANFP